MLVADAAHALQSVARCQLAMDYEEAERPRDLASSLPVPHLFLCISPFLPAPLRALHSFAQLMKINESKNVAYSFPWSRLLPFLVGFALFSFPFLCPFYSALLWVLHALIYIPRRSSSCGNANGAAEVAAAAVAFHFKAATKTSTATQST